MESVALPRAHAGSGHRFRRSAAAAGLAGVLALSTGLAMPVRASAASLPLAGKPEITTIKYQTLPGSLDVLELADKLGYLKPLTLDPVGVVQGGPASAQAVATGQSYIGHIANNAFLNLISAGAKVKAVLTDGGVTKATAGGWYVLKSSKIHDAKDLIGKKAAVNTLGAAAQGEVDTYLTNAKLTKAQIAKVTMAVIPSTNQAEALEKGAVDIASLSPLEAKALKSKVRELFNTFQIYGKMDDDSWIMADSFLQKYPNTTHALIAAMAKATLWTQTHPLAQVKKVYESFLHAHNRKQEAEDIQNTYVGSSVNARGGVLKAKDFTYWVTWLKGQGQLKGWDASVSQLFTNAYNPYASK